MSHTYFGEGPFYLSFNKPGRIFATKKRNAMPNSKISFQYPQAGSYLCNCTLGASGVRSDGFQYPQAGSYRCNLSSDMVRLWLGNFQYPQAGAYRCNLTSRMGR